MNTNSLSRINLARLWGIWTLILLLGIPQVLHAKSSYAYRPSLGAESPALDVYTKNNLKNAPVLIYVHGGAWRKGDKSRVHAKPKHFNKLGFVFVSINYRLVPGVTVETQLEDVDQALNWVTQNITKHGGNPKNLHLMGHSAGAHLVAMTGVRPLTSAKRLITAGALRSILSNDTRAYDLPRIAKNGRGGKMPKIYASVFGLEAARWQALSPIYQLKPGQNLPDFLVLYSGQGNTATRRAFTVDFVRSMHKVGGSAELFDGSKYSHAKINQDIGGNNEVTRSIDRFLAAQAQ